MIFVLAMAGNIMEWKALSETERGDWRYDFTKGTTRNARSY